MLKTQQNKYTFFNIGQKIKVLESTNLLYEEINEWINK